MKNRLYMILMLIGISFFGISNSVIGYQFEMLENQKVEWHMHKLKSELSKNTLMRGLGYTSLCVGLGSLIWYIGFRTPGAPVLPAAGAPINLEAVANSLAATADSMNATVRECVKAPQSSLFGLRTVYSWLKSQMNQVAVLLLFKGLNDTLGPLLKPVAFLNGIASRTLGAIYHDCSITWYLDSHTKLPLILNELEVQAGVLAGKSIRFPHQSQGQTPVLALTPLSVPDAAIVVGLFDRDHYRESFAITWNLMIADLESVLGFLEYKKHQMMRDSLLVVHRINAIEDQIARHVQDSYQKVLQAIQSDQDANILDYIIQFRARLNIEIQSYILLESL